MSTSPLQLVSTPEASAAVSAWSRLSDAQRAEVARRRQIVDAWRRTQVDFVSAGGRKSDATALFLSQHPGLSQATLYRWSNLRDCEDPTALLDRRTNRELVRDERVGESAWQTFLGVYLTIQRRSVALCWQIVQAEALKHADDPAWQWPALRTVQLKAARIPSSQADYFRLGDREWRRRHELSIPREYEAYRPGEYWVGDFHEFDIFCRRSESDPTIIRPLLGSFIDLRSRLIMGWYIGEAETADAVLLTLADGLRKYGAPWHMVIDNGKPYRAQGVSGGRPQATRLIGDEEAFRQRVAVLPGLNIAVHFSIPFNPNSKLIERWHGTLEGQFGALFETYCGGQKDDRFRAACKLAHDHPERCPTMADLRTKFGAWIEGYARTPHTGAGMESRPPLWVFENCDPIPRAVLPDGALDLLVLKPVGPVKVTKNGVRYSQVEYGSSDPRLWDLHGQKVLLRVHPEDASFVWICDLEGRPLIRAENNRLALAGATREDVSTGMKAKARARRYAREIRAGAVLPALQSTVDAAIAARLESGERAMQKLIQATGTDGPRAEVGGLDADSPGTAPARTIAPLRSDFQAPRCRAGVPADPARPRRSLADLAARLAPAPDLVAPVKRRDLAEVFGGHDSAGESEGGSSA